MRYNPGVLLELRVENLVLIERAELRLGPGLNVITGETGAGKTMLASALDLLLGGRSKQSLVRTGAAEAYVEGVFDLTDPLRALLGDRIPSDAEELVLARRITAEGRTRAYVAGRTATATELRETAENPDRVHGAARAPAARRAPRAARAVDAAAGPDQAGRVAKAAAAHQAGARRAGAVGRTGRARGGA